MTVKRHVCLQDVESYDPVLNPVLNREVRRTGGRVLITLGDQDIDLSPSFVIFLSTRDPTVRSRPSPGTVWQWQCFGRPSKVDRPVTPSGRWSSRQTSAPGSPLSTSQSRAAVCRASVSMRSSKQKDPTWTRNALTSSSSKVQVLGTGGAGLLGADASSLCRLFGEEVSLQQTRHAVLPGEFQLRLRQLEKSLLQALNEVKGRILDDDTIITTLENLKREAAEVTRKVEETDIVMQEVETVSQQYLPLSTACSSIYFTMESLKQVTARQGHRRARALLGRVGADVAASLQIHFLYQYSLQFFLDIYHNVLYENPNLKGITDHTQRLSIITKDLFQVRGGSRCRRAGRRAGGRRLQGAAACPALAPRWPSTGWPEACCIRTTSPLPCCWRGSS